jgi:antitoxin MazE
LDTTGYAVGLRRIIVKVAKWGNSLAVRLPRSVVEVLKLKEGDSVEIEVVETRSFKIARTPTRKEILARLDKYRGRVPADFKFDRWEANSRG